MNIWWIPLNKNMVYLESVRFLAIQLLSEFFGQPSAGWDAMFDLDLLSSCNVRFSHHDMTPVLRLWFYGQPSAGWDAMLDLDFFSSCTVRFSHHNMTPVLGLVSDSEAVSSILS